MKSITVQELSGRLKDNPQIIDVRAPSEYQAAHIKDSQLIPMDMLKPDDLDADRPVYLLCRSGSRAKTVCERLEGVENIDPVVIEGGMTAWIEAGFDYIKGAKRMSIERQVRIVAGLLVLIGTLLAAFVNPWLAIIPGFVGAGLTFAGITDFCGMGILIMKMPWNRKAT